MNSSPSTLLLLSLNEAISSVMSLALNYKTQIIVPKSNNACVSKKLEIKRNLEILLYILPLRSHKNLIGLLSLISGKKL